MRALVNTVKRLMYIINLLEKENNTTMKPLSIFNCRNFFFRYILQLSKYRLKKKCNANLLFSPRQIVIKRKWL
jgi:hypothetical protein